MTAHTPIPVRDVRPDWCFIRVALDTEDDRILDDLFSGKHDRRRLRNSAQALAMIAELPPVCVSDDLEARERADNAVRGLIGGLL